jgi:PhoPQ-activated pathogenicity-related protein
MNASRCASALAVCLLVVAPACARAGVPGELALYVAAPDASYAWREVQSRRIGSTEVTELVLTSQTWRGIPWKHHLILARPSNLDTSSGQVFLFIHGGRWKPEYESGFQGTLPREALIFAKLAETMRAPVAVLRQVPFQPLFDRREDALIAYTFDNYLAGGDTDWPLLLPMVKSAVRSMDAIQAFARERWQMPVASFTVAGASKRGWTSWLTAAVDPRVSSVAPIAIDMLNLPAQIALQRETFGGLSDKVQDYVAIDLPGRVATERGRSLMAMVDPYQYLADLTPPKLILLGTNDRYWPLDALRLYWDGLPEPKRVLYVPNQGHGVRDLDRLIGGLSALHRYSVHGEQLPAVTWTYAAQADRLGVEVHTNRVPRRVLAWTATSASRDFREAHWTSHRCKRRDGKFACSVAQSPDGYTAMYAELWFKDPGYPKFPLATVVCIAGGPEGGAPDC